MTGKMVDYSSRNTSYRSSKKDGDEYSPHIENSLRSLKEEIRSFKVDTDIIIQSQERFSRAYEKKEEFMQASFRVCQNCRDMERLGSIMDMRKRLMEPMVAYLMMDTCLIGIIPSGMAGY